MADDFRARAYQRFLGQGYEPHQARAMVSHVLRESGGSSTVPGDRGTSFGLFQWHDPKPGAGRWTELKDWAAAQGRDPNDEKTQLDFAHHELQTSEKAAGDRLKAAKTEAEASDAMYAYLRPLNWNTAQRPSTPGVDATAVAASAPPSGDNQQIVAGLLAKQQEQAAAQAAAVTAMEEAKQARGYQGITKVGLGLLDQGEAVAPQTPMQPLAIHRPQVQSVGNPDFTQILARQRLRRRV